MDMTRLKPTRPNRVIPSGLGITRRVVRPGEGQGPTFRRTGAASQGPAGALCNAACRAQAAAWRAPAVRGAPRRSLTLQLGSGVDSPADTHERQPSGIDRRLPDVPVLPSSLLQG